MPGFNVIKDNSFSLDAKNVEIPRNPIYTYTWDIDSFLGINVYGKPILYLKECSFPSYSFDVETVDTGHAKYHFPSSITWDDVKIVFYGTKDLIRKLEEYKNKLWNDKNGVRPINDFVDTTVIRVFTYDNKEAMKYTLNNAWIKSLSYSNLTYENSDILNVSAVISYSWADVLVYNNR